MKKPPTYAAAAGRATASNSSDQARALKKPEIRAMVGLATTSNSSDRARALKKVHDESTKKGAVDSAETTAGIKAAYRRIRSETNRDSRTRGAGAYACETEEQMATYRRGLRAREAAAGARTTAAEKRRARTVECHSKWQALADAERRKRGPKRTKWKIATEIARHCRNTRGKCPLVRTVWRAII